MRVPFLNKLLQQITGSTDQSFQHGRVFSHDSHDVSPEAEQDGLPLISELEPGLVSWQPSISSQLADNEVYENSGLFLSSEKKRLVKRAIDQHNLLELKRELGPELFDVHALMEAQTIY